MSQPSLCLVYAYYEKDIRYRTNLIYFLKHGYRKDPNIDYVIVVNGSHTVHFPTEYNLKVIQRENTGFDFQGYYIGIMSLKKKYDYYIFLNASVRGPFVPSYASNYFRWYQPFIDLLKSSPILKLVGSTINVQPPSDRLFVDQHAPHVQSYCFVMDWICLDYLVSSTDLFKKYYQDKHDVIAYQEIGMSALVLKRGWNISCLIPEFQKIDYRDGSIANKIIGDVLWPKNGLGRIVHPYETIFYKTDRGISVDELESLTNNQLSIHDMCFHNDPGHHVAVCFHLGYGNMFPQFSKYIWNVYHSGYNVDLYVTYQKKTDPINLIQKQYPNAVFIQTTRGCDTGAFLLQLEYIYRNCPNKYEYIFKIHTKKREDWRTELLETIAGTVHNVHKVYDCFRSDQKVGLISGSSTWIHSTDSINEPLISELCRKLSIRVTRESRFVGGTIFWIRWSLLKQFIETSHIDLKQEYERCEQGYLLNNKPTMTHSWERLYGYLVSNYGFKVSSITSSSSVPSSSLSVSLPLNHSRHRFVIRKVCYGVSESDSIDVTDLIRTKVPVNLRLINTNEQWGDPNLGHPKKVMVYLSNSLNSSNSTVVIKEYAGRVMPNHFVIIHDGMDLLWQFEDNDNLENYVTIKSHDQLGHCVTTFFDWTYYYQKYTPWLTANTYQECLQHYIKYGYESNLQTFEPGVDLLKKFKIQLIALWCGGAHLPLAPLGASPAGSTTSAAGSTTSPAVSTSAVSTTSPAASLPSATSSSSSTGGVPVSQTIDLNQLKRHIQQARGCGINGFCFQHFWDNGGCRYYKAAELLMKSPVTDPDCNFPYCFSWITETTSSDRNQWTDHFSYLLPYFRDPRYIKVNQQPVFLIPFVAKTDPFVLYWNQLAASVGLKGIFFIDTLTTSQTSQTSQCSTFINPFYGQKMYPQYFHPKRNYSAMDYPRLSRALVNQKKPCLVHFRDVMIGFDNTKHSENPNKIICESFTAKSVYCVLKSQIERVLETFNPEIENFIFLHSWNDWENQMVIEGNNAVMNSISNVVYQYQNPQLYNKVPDLLLGGTH